MQSSAPDDLRKLITREIGAEQADIVLYDGILGMAQLSELIVSDRPDLQWPCDPKLLSKLIALRWNEVNEKTLQYDKTPMLVHRGQLNDNGMIPPRLSSEPERLHFPTACLSATCLCLFSAAFMVSWKCACCDPICIAPLPSDTTPHGARGQHARGQCCT